MAQLALRLIAVLLAVAGVVVGVRAYADARRCEDARRSLFVATLRSTSDPVAVAAVAERCASPETVAAAAAGIARADPAGATRLAREAARRAPETFGPWAALAIADRDSAAWERARTLNPRWRTAAPR
ncbi:MAG: hypothetical protein V9E83_14625 [Baekduia sp.]